MSLRWLVLAGFLAAVALAPAAAACTVEPPSVCPADTDLAAVCVQGPCPPATNGGVSVRVLGYEVGVPLGP